MSLHEIVTNNYKDRDVATYLAVLRAHCVYTDEEVYMVPSVFYNYSAIELAISHNLVLTADYILGIHEFVELNRQEFATRNFWKHVITSATSPEMWVMLSKHPKILELVSDDSVMACLRDMINSPQEYREDVYRVDIAFFWGLVYLLPEEDRKQDVSKLIEEVGDLFVLGTTKTDVDDILLLFEIDPEHTKANNLEALKEATEELCADKDQVLKSVGGSGKVTFKGVKHPTAMLHAFKLLASCEMFASTAASERRGAFVSNVVTILNAFTKKVDAEVECQFSKHLYHVFGLEWDEDKVDFDGVFTKLLSFLGHYFPNTFRDLFCGIDRMMLQCCDEDGVTPGGDFYSTMDLDPGLGYRTPLYFLVSKGLKDLSESGLSMKMRCPKCHRKKALVERVRYSAANQYAILRVNEGTDVPMGIETFAVFVLDETHSEPQYRRVTKHGSFAVYQRFNRGKETPPVSSEEDGELAKKYPYSRFADLEGLRSHSLPPSTATTSPLDMMEEKDTILSSDMKESDLYNEKEEDSVQKKENEPSLPVIATPLQQGKTGAKSSPPKYDLKQRLSFYIGRDNETYNECKEAIKTYIRATRDPAAKAVPSREGFFNSRALVTCVLRKYFATMAYILANDCIGDLEAAKKELWKFAYTVSKEDPKEDPNVSMNLNIALFRLLSLYPKWFGVFSERAYLTGFNPTPPEIYDLKEDPKNFVFNELMNVVFANSPDYADNPKWLANYLDMGEVITRLHKMPKLGVWSLGNIDRTIYNRIAKEDVNFLEEDGHLRKIRESVRQMKEEEEREIQKKKDSEKLEPKKEESSPPPSSPMEPPTTPEDPTPQESGQAEKPYAKGATDQPSSESEEETGEDVTKEESSEESGENEEESSGNEEEEEENSESNEEEHPTSEPKYRDLIDAVAHIDLNSIADILKDYHGYFSTESNVNELRGKFWDTFVSKEPDSQREILKLLMEKREVLGRLSQASFIRDTLQNLVSKTGDADLMERSICFWAVIRLARWEYAADVRDNIRDLRKGIFKAPGMSENLMALDYWSLENIVKLPAIVYHNNPIERDFSLVGVVRSGTDDLEAYVNLVKKHGSYEADASINRLKWDSKIFTHEAVSLAIEKRFVLALDYLLSLPDMFRLNKEYFKTKFWYEFSKFSDNVTPSMFAMITRNPIKEQISDFEFFKNALETYNRDAGKLAGVTAKRNVAGLFSWRTTEDEKTTHERIRGRFLGTTFLWMAAWMIHGDSNILGKFEDTYVPKFVLEMKKYDETKDYDDDGYRLLITVNDILATMNKENSDVFHYLDTKAIDLEYSQLMSNAFVRVLKETTATTAARDWYPLENAVFRLQGLMLDDPLYGAMCLLASCRQLFFKVSGINKAIDKLVDLFLEINDRLTNPDDYEDVRTVDPALVYCLCHQLRILFGDHWESGNRVFVKLLNFLSPFFGEEMKNAIGFRYIDYTVCKDNHIVKIGESETRWFAEFENLREKVVKKSVKCTHEGCALQAQMMRRIDSEGSYFIVVDKEIKGRRTLGHREYKEHDAYVQTFGKDDSKKYEQACLLNSTLSKDVVTFDHDNGGGTAMASSFNDNGAFDSDEEDDDDEDDDESDDEADETAGHDFESEDKKETGADFDISAFSHGTLVETKEFRTSKDGSDYYKSLLKNDDAPVRIFARLAPKDDAGRKKKSFLAKNKKVLTGAALLTVGALAGAAAYYSGVDVVGTINQLMAPAPTNALVVYGQHQGTSTLGDLVQGLSSTVTNAVGTVTSSIAGAGAMGGTLGSVSLPQFSVVTPQPAPTVATPVPQTTDVALYAPQPTGDAPPPPPASSEIVQPTSALLDSPSPQPTSNPLDAPSPPPASSEIVQPTSNPQPTSALLDAPSPQATTPNYHPHLTIGDAPHNVEQLTNRVTDILHVPAQQTPEAHFAAVEKTGELVRSLIASPDAFKNRAVLIDRVTEYARSLVPTDPGIDVPIAEVATITQSLVPVLAASTEPGAFEAAQAVIASFWSGITTWASGAIESMVGTGEVPSEVGVIAHRAFGGTPIGEVTKELVTAFKIPQDVIDSTPNFDEVANSATVNFLSYLRYPMSPAAPPYGRSYAPPVPEVGLSLFHGTTPANATHTPGMSSLSDAPLNLEANPFGPPSTGTMSGIPTAPLEEGDLSTYISASIAFIQSFAPAMDVAFMDFLKPITDMEYFKLPIETIVQNIEIGDEGALAASALLLPLVGYMISDSADKILEQTKELSRHHGKIISHLGLKNNNNLLVASVSKLRGSGVNHMTPTATGFHSRYLKEKAEIKNLEVFYEEVYSTMLTNFSGKKGSWSSKAGHTTISEYLNDALCHGDLRSAHYLMHELSADYSPHMAVHLFRDILFWDPLATLLVLKGWDFRAHDKELRALILKSPLGGKTYTDEEVFQVFKNYCILLDHWPGVEGHFSRIFGTNRQKAFSKIEAYLKKHTNQLSQECAKQNFPSALTAAFGKGDWKTAADVYLKYLQIGANHLLDSIIHRPCVKLFRNPEWKKSDSTSKINSFVFAKDPYNTLNSIFVTLGQAQFLETVLEKLIKTKNDAVWAAMLKNMFFPFGEGAIHKFHLNPAVELHLHHLFKTGGSIRLGNAVLCLDWVLILMDRFGSPDMKSELFNLFGTACLVGVKCTECHTYYRTGNELHVQYVVGKEAILGEENLETVMAHCPTCRVERVMTPTVLDTIAPLYLIRKHGWVPENRFVSLQSNTYIKSGSRSHGYVVPLDIGNGGKHYQYEITGYGIKPRGIDGKEFLDGHAPFRTKKTPPTQGVGVVGTELRGDLIRVTEVCLIGDKEYPVSSARDLTTAEYEKSGTPMSNDTDITKMIKDGLRSFSIYTLADDEDDVGMSPARSIDYLALVSGYPRDLDRYGTKISIDQTDYHLGF